MPLFIRNVDIASDQTVTGAKTFNATKLLMRNVADTFSSLFTNVNTAARTYTLPDTNGEVALIGGMIGADLIHNLSIANSVAASALTISLKTAAGADASATDPIKVAFRSATLATGTVSLVNVTAALSTVISSGSTAGHSSGVEGFVYVYLLNNAGTLELGWSGVLFDENKLVTTTAEGGAGAADLGYVMYSTTARTNVAFRLIGRLLSTQTTSGTWAAVPTNIQVGSVGKIEPSAPVTTRATNNVSTTIAVSGDTLIPYLLTTGNFYDSHGGWAASIYTVQTAGKYRINARIRMSDSLAYTVQDYIGLYAKIDGATYYALASSFAQVTQTQNTGAVISGVTTINLTAGQTIRIVANTVLTATKTTIASQPNYNDVQIERVGQ